jgi:hypothetical protein
MKRVPIVSISIKNRLYAGVIPFLLLIEIHTVVLLSESYKKNLLSRKKKSESV